MRLTYQTTVATLVQFIVLGLLNIANTIDSVVTTCRYEQASCLSNLLTSSIIYIALTGWFGLIAVLGYGAQQRRSKRLAQLLIAAEGLTVLVAAFNIKLNLDYANGLLSLVTSFTDILFGLWVISLAYRLMRSGGGRITTVSRPRRRLKRPIS